MSHYTGDERRDQTERGKELRRLVGLAITVDAAGRTPTQMLYALASMAWKLGFEHGRAKGALEVMEHVESELGALREGLKEPTNG